MPVPDFQTVMLPFMQRLADGQEWKMRDVFEALASGFSLTEDERREMLPSGQSKVFNNRVGWAKTHLKNAGLVDNPTRGKVRMSDRGRQVLAQTTASIDMKFLCQFDGYRSVSPNGVTCHLRALEKWGYIHRDANQLRSIIILGRGTRRVTGVRRIRALALKRIKTRGRLSLLRAR